MIIGFFLFAFNSVNDKRVLRLLLRQYDCLRSERNVLRISAHDADNFGPTVVPGASAPKMACTLFVSGVFANSRPRRAVCARAGGFWQSDVGVIVRFGGKKASTVT